MPGANESTTPWVHGVNIDARCIVTRLLAASAAPRSATATREKRAIGRRLAALGSFAHADTPIQLAARNRFAYQPT
jgi:hypothetical protein